MLKKDVSNGRIYAARISGRIVPVQLLCSRKGHTGRTYWYGRNLVTGREVSIRSAAKLRYEIAPERLSPSAYGRMS